MTVDLTRQDEFAVLTLNRPDALNALNAALIRDFRQALEQVASSDTRALLITGAGGRAFCAGADVKELAAQPLLEQKRTLREGQAAFAQLDTLPMPSIALVGGHALGGGLELALACTFRLAGPRARLGFPEIRLGLVPGYGGTQRLPRLIGPSRALDMILTARTLDADQALAAGLVDRRVEGDLVEAGIEYAREFSGFGLPALNLAREAVLRSLDTPLDEGLRIESDLAGLAMATEDAREGMLAFAGKRPPVFRDC